MNKPGNRLTLRAVADRAGVTAATVSLALRDHPSLPESTRRRIQRLAARMGYRPDPQVSRLMAHLRMSRRVKTVSTLGLLNLWQVCTPWLGPGKHHLLRAYRGLEARAEALGFRLESVGEAENRVSPERLRRILIARGIEGLLVLGGPAYLQEIDFDFSGLACAALGYSVAVRMHRACAHQYQEMFRALESLRRLGYRRPGLVLREDTDRRVMHHYSAAWALARARRWWPDMPDLVVSEVTFEVFRDWFRVERPDVLLVQSPPVTQWLEWLPALGLRVPEDIGLAMLDIDLAGPPTAGIVQDSEGVSAAAVDLVVAQLHRSERGLPANPKVVQIEGRWVDGPTVRAQ